MELKPCPNCESTDLKVLGVYVKCNHCLMEGPKSNDGRNDEHADYRDHELAIEYWNKLIRKNEILEILYDYLPNDYYQLIRKKL